MINLDRILIVEMKGMISEGDIDGDIEVLQALPWASAGRRAGRVQHARRLAGPRGMGALSEDARHSDDSAQ
jgi:hypothetical protein